MASTPSPRLISDGPKYEGGEPGYSELKQRFGKVLEIVHEGVPLVRTSPGSPVALWGIPGTKIVARTRKDAIREYRRAKRLLDGQSVSVS